MTTWRSGDELAVDVGRLCAVDDVLHRLLGSAANKDEDPAIAVLFDEWSMQAAEHNEWLTDRLPFRAGFDRGAVRQLGTYRDLVEALQHLTDDHNEVGLFAGVVEVLFPAILDDLAQIDTRCSPAADRSLQRRLGFLTSDLTKAVLDGRGYLGRLTTDAPVRASVASAVASLPSVRLF